MTKFINFLPAFISNKLKGRTNFQEILANTGWLCGDKILQMGVGLLVGVWVARYLGAEQLGQYGYASAFVVLFLAFATLGLNSIVPREIVRDPSSKEEIMGTAFILFLFSGLVTALITSAAIFLLRPHDSLMHWLVGILAAGMIFQAFNTIELYFQSMLQSKYIVYAQNGAFIIISFSKIVLVLNHASLIVFVSLGLAETILRAVGLVIAYRLNGQSMKGWRWNTLRAKSLLNFSWPLIFSSIFTLVNMQIDKVMIGEISGSIQVGLFSVASRFTEMLYFLPVAVGFSVAPALIKERAANVFSYHVKLQKTYNLMTVFAIAVAVPMTFLSKVLINILYGSAYSGSAHMLAIHIWSALFVFHTSIRSRSLIIEGKQKFVLFYAFFAMISNVIFNYILIPKYGGVGASYASLLSWMLCVLLLPYISSKTSESVPMFLRSLNFIYLLKK